MSEYDLISGMPIGIKDGEFREAIERLAETGAARLNIEEVKDINIDRTKLLVKSSADSALSVMKDVDRLRSKYAGIPEAEILLDRIVKTVCSGTLAAENLCEIIKDNTPDNIKKQSIEMRRMLKEFVVYVMRSVPKALDADVVFRSNVRKDVFVSVRATELSLILTNLVVNALEHAHSASNRVEIILNRICGKRKVAISVLDYGVGVDIEKIRSIIIKKANDIRIGYDYQETYNCCGLIACIKIAERMGAEILVSNYPGAGAVFTVLLDADMNPSVPRITRFSDKQRMERETFEERLIYIAMQSF